MIQAGCNIVITIIKYRYDDNQYKVTTNRYRESNIKLNLLRERVYFVQHFPLLA